MAEQTAETLAQRLLDLSLVDPQQIQELWGEFGRKNVSGDAFLQALLRKEYLTSFQADRLLKGERAGYFYGDYKVLYLVASGTFARVYRAVHKHTGQVVALKVLRKRYSDDPQQTEHFVREGHVGLLLRHPNIVPIYEVASKERSHFLVMEFIEGRNLREFLKVRKKLEPLEATELVFQTMSGLNYAAGKGVQHRDIKLTNILVSSRGEAKLVDFGLAAAEAALETETDLATQRTVDYAGLERASGVKKDDPRSDMFFVGCIYYHMVTGKPALYETKDRIKRLAKARYQDIPPLHEVAPELPLAVSHVIGRAIQFDPKQRYQTPGEMLEELRDARERLLHDAGPAPADAPAAGDARVAVPIRQRTILYLESDVRAQDLVREALKKDGYRVLVLSDPARAVQRFEENPRTAEAVIVSAGQLGAAAIDAWRQLATSAALPSLPIVLLLDREHADLAAAKPPPAAPHRRTLHMPLKLRALRECLAELTIPAPAA